MDDTPLCKMSKPNQILMLERVSHLGQRVGLNTITVVSEDLYRKHDYSTSIKTSHRHHRIKESEPEWAQQDRLDQLIKGIRAVERK